MKENSFTLKKKKKKKKLKSTKFHKNYDLVF